MSDSESQCRAGDLPRATPVWTSCKWDENKIVLNKMRISVGHKKPEQLTRKANCDDYLEQDD